MIKNKLLKKIVLSSIIALILIKASSFSLLAQSFLSKEEETYIANRGLVTAASINGAAPLHYTNSKGEITGIAISVLDEITQMTGLEFEYKLYESTREVFVSGADLIFGITPNYAPENMILSQAYLNSQTILFFNSSLDPNHLEDKKFAAILGGKLPEGIKEVNTLFFDSREATLDAVEKGLADYSYGNEYSVSFYTIQNSYKNIITIPKEKEVRAYSMGFFKEDPILISIINKSINELSEADIVRLVLDHASKIERKITFPMIIDSYGGLIFGLIGLAILALLIAFVATERAKRSSKLQNKKYELLSQISNEYLFEYHVKTNDMILSEKYVDLFGHGDSYKQVITSLKKCALHKKNMKRF